jgi:hypothetical protein
LEVIGAKRELVVEAEEYAFGNHAAFYQTSMGEAYRIKELSTDWKSCGLIRRVEQDAIRKFQEA